eukprot:ANDGO_06396.mRNA.1 hypothetical protein
MKIVFLVAAVFCLLAVSTASVPRANALECGVCKLVITELDRVVESNRTETFIVKELDNVCSKIAHPLASLCESLVNAYTDDIVTWLVNKFPAEAFCEKVGFCAATEVSVVEEPVESELECALCGAMFDAVEIFLAGNYSESNIEAALNEVCSKFGPLASVCQGIIDQYTPQIIQYLEAKYTPTVICQKLNLCNASMALTEAVAQEAVVATAVDVEASGLECTICKLVLSEVENLLAGNYSESKIEAALDSVCSKLGPLGPICQSLINQYTPAIIGYLEQKYPADVICQKISLCTSSMEEAVAPEGAVGGNAIECVICQLISKELEQIIASQTVVTDVEKVLDGICAKLGPLSGVCTALVNQYAPAIIQYLDQKYPLDQLCTTLKLCAPSSMEAPVAVKANVVECELCKLIMGEAEKLIGNQRTEANIMDILDNKLCAALPASLSGMCVELVADYFPALVQAFLQKETPPVICYELTLCNSPTKCGSRSASKVAIDMMPIEVAAAPVQNAVECEICKLIISEAEKIIASNRTEAAILNGLDQVCAKLPASLNDICQSLIATYLPVIVYELSEFATPAKVCSEIKICPAPSAKAIWAVLQPTLLPQRN